MHCGTIQETNHSATRQPAHCSVRNYSPRERATRNMRAMFKNNENISMPCGVNRLELEIAILSGGRLLVSRNQSGPNLSAPIWPIWRIFQSGPIRRFPIWYQPGAHFPDWPDWGRQIGARLISTDQPHYASARGKGTWWVGGWVGGHFWSGSDEPGHLGRLLGFRGNSPSGVL